MSPKECSTAGTSCGKDTFLVSLFTSQGDIQVELTVTKVLAHTFTGNAVELTTHLKIQFVLVTSSN